MTTRAIRSLPLVVLALVCTTSRAQPRLQVGLGAVPGAGIQLGYVDVHSVYTIETAFYGELKPSLGRSRAALVTSGGVGVSFRPLGALRVIGQADFGYDLDLGVRFGPSLQFTHRATRSDKNKQFRLFLDPFLRLVKPRSGGGAFYAEIGPLRPVLRLGAWLRL